MAGLLGVKFNSKRFFLITHPINSGHGARDYYLLLLVLKSYMSYTFTGNT